MEDICESGVVPSLTFVAENIYTSCDIEKNDAVSASTLVDYVRPLISGHPTEISELFLILDPNNENPKISSSTFYDAMKKWTAKIKSSDKSLSHFSFRELDTSDEKELPFHQSTPKPSLEPPSTQNIPNILNFSNLSPTSFSNYDKSGSTVACEKLILEERVKELEHKYSNALNELSMVKSQLQASEEQYADLKHDLDRTNRRLLLEQQIIADLQKSMEHNDDYKEEIINTKKENEYLQKMWASSKKENSNLIASIRDLEFEKEQFERKISEIHKKDDLRKQEVSDLQTALSLTEEENKSLKKLKNELKDKVDEQQSLLKHFTEISEFMKNENHTLRLVVKKTGLLDLSNPSSLKDLPNLSSHGSTPINSPKSPCIKKTDLKSSTPFKNMYHPKIFERKIFNSPTFIRQLKSPVSPDGFDTPIQMRLMNSSNNVKNSTQDSSKNGVKHSPKRDQGIESPHFDSPKNSTSMNSLVDDAENEHQNVSNKTDTPSPTLSSGNAVCETFEDLDFSIVSEKLSSKGQDLLSELQACKLLDNSDECFVTDHVDLSKIVKDHENCSKIIAEYQQRIDFLAKDVEDLEIKHQNLLVDYNNVKERSNYLEQLLNNEKNVNEHLALENFNLTKRVANLNDTGNEKENKLHELENEKKALEEEIEKIKKEEENTCTQYSTLVKKYDSLINLKIGLENQLDQIKTENVVLLNDKSHIHTKINVLTNIIESKNNEIQELQTVRTENEQLKEEINNTKMEQLKNFLTIKDLTEKIEHSKDMSNHFVQIIKDKLIDQNSRVQFLRESNSKLQHLVDDLSTELEHLKTELYLVKSSSEEFSFGYKLENKVNIEEESTSKEGSETSLCSERLQLKKKQKSIKRSNYDKQQLKIMKLEEQVEILQGELFNEKVKTQTMYGLEVQVSNLEVEKMNLEHEKIRISNELDAIKYDLSLKELIMKQLEESHKFEVDNLSETFSREKEIISINSLNAQQNATENERSLKKQVENLENEVINLKEEKKLLESLLDKQETKIITLKKALSDITKSSEEANILENIVIEKESILQFNRELLLKSNNSLQLSENTLCSLKLLLDQCKMVLLETADNLFRATNEAFEAWKNDLNGISEDHDLIRALKYSENNGDEILSDLTEENIEKINSNIKLSAKLLRALAQKPGSDCLLCKNNLPAVKGVNKFTLKPKLQLRRLPSSDPDISSSCMKEGESPQAKDNIEEDSKTNLVSSKMLKKNDSITDWLGHRTNNLSVQMRHDSPNSTLRLRDVSTETDNSDRLLQFSSGGDSDMHEITQSRLMLDIPRRRSSIRMLSEKCTTFGMMMFSIICFLAMFLIYLHLECIRNGNGSVVCPLDFLVSVRRVQSKFHPH